MKKQSKQLKNKLLNVTFDQKLNFSSYDLEHFHKARPKINPESWVTTFIGCDKDTFFLPPFNYCRLHACSIFGLVITGLIISL